jgi:hypothetical protein
MALFSIKNERDLIVANGLANDATAAAFVTSGTAGEALVLDQYGAVPVGKTKFSVYVKHLDGRVRKSDLIDPDKIVQFKKQIPVTAVLPKSVVTVTTATLGDLYEVAIKVFNDGALSNDNTVLLNATFVAADTNTTNVAVGIVASFNAAQTRMGQTYFTCTNTGAAITFQSTALPFVTGKKDGRQIDYVIKATQVNPNTLAVGSLTTVNTAGVLDPTSLNYLADLEYQTRGAFGDSLRGLAYPFDFALQSDVVAGTAYTLYEFDFYDGDGNSHNVQKSPRHLTVAVPAANVAAFDATIATVRSVIDLSIVGTDTQVLKWTDAAGTYHPGNDLLV